MAKPLRITSRREFEKVWREAVDRTAKISGLDPSWELPKQIQRQLDFLRDSVRGDRQPTEAEKAKVDIGPIAVRNFEGSDDAYADLLKELDYAFSRWEDLP